MDDEPPLPGGGSGGGGGGGSGGGDSYYMPNYGTNLWVALLGMTNDTLSLLETNTISDVLYELQGCTNLISPNWVSYGFATGAELTNCTPATAPVSQQGNMFFRIRSWQGVDGIPFWWFLTYLGQDTNVSGEMFAPSGDGWTLLQCFQNGYNPTNWVTPPAPQGLTITSFSSTNNTATLGWMLSAGPVLGYNVQTPNETNIVGTGVNSYADNSSSPSATYSIQAIYSGGVSAWSPPVSVADFLRQQTSPESANNTLSASIAAGPQGSAYLAVNVIPASTYELKIIRVDEIASYIFDDGSYNSTNYISVTDATNGFYAMSNVMVPPDPYVQEYPFTEYDDGGFQSEQNWYAQAIVTNGISTASIYIGSSYTSPLDDYQSSWTVPPYFDGREQLKQNLIFLLRQPTLVPFEYELKDDSGEPYSYKAEQEPTNYAYAGIFDAQSVWTGYALSSGDNGLDACRPFYENYLYANFVYETNDVGTNGFIGPRVNELFDPYYPDTEEVLLLTNQPPFLFQPPTAQGATIPPQMSNSDWLYSLPFTRYIFGYTNGVYYCNGFTYYNTTTNGIGVYTIENNPINYFGIPIQSAQVVYASNDPHAPIQFGVESPGESFTGALAYIFPDAVQPGFQTVEYDFWNPATDSLPGNSAFTPTNNSNFLIASVADPTYQVAAFAKLAVTNSIYSSVGVYGYLGQYFTNAYEIDSNGNVTANTTGVLSSYGQFFATEPGQAALVTMPDPDTRQQATDAVDIISLNVDANHDGTMDFNFTGPDFVTTNNPYRFWVNDDADSGDDFGDGVSVTNSSADGVAFSAYNGKR